VNASRLPAGGTALALTLVLALAGCAGAPASDRTVTVFAASSLTGVFADIAELDPTLDVRFTFDGSSTLVDQLAGGAPADVLATADEATMARATQASLVEPEPTVFATNAGVLIVPAGNPAGVTGLDASLDGTKLVVCAPTVPCGATARALADAAGVALAPVSEEQKVTDVRGKVASGEADAGIVFATDATAAGDAVETIVLDPDGRFATRYPVAVVAGSANAETAHAFIDLVTSDAGRVVLAEHGFGTP